MSLDPVTLSVLSGALAGIAEEMGAVLIRGAYSSNIKERRDCSAALFDARGRMVAQAEHIPVHLGAMPEAVAAVIEHGPEPSDVWILNDPYRGGTHLPDVTLVAPVALDGAIAAYAVTRAHHSDVGGMSPGSMPASSRDIWQEGLVIPPARLVRGGELDAGLLDLILANVRTPELRRGDLRAQLAAGRIAAARLAELVERRGRELVEAAFSEVLAYTERRTREAIAALPDGTYTARGEIEGDGVVDEDIPIAVRVEVAGDALRIDFDGTSGQVSGNVNCPLAVTRSACLFALRVLLPPDVPANAGTFAPVTIAAPAGSLVNALPAGSRRRGQRRDLAADRRHRAARARAGRRPAGPGSGHDEQPDHRRARLDLLRDDRGRAGRERRRPGPVRRARRDDQHAQHAGRGARARVPDARRALRAGRGSGGAGRHRGGDGLVRAVRVLEPAVVNLLTDRRRHAPQGAHGGEPGRPGENRLGEEPLPPKATRELAAGEVVELRTPGGGGWGEP